MVKEGACFQAANYLYLQYLQLITSDCDDERLNDGSDSFVTGIRKWYIIINDSYWKHLFPATYFLCTESEILIAKLF